VTSQFGVQWRAVRPDSTYSYHLHCLPVNPLSDFLLTAVTPALTLQHSLAFCWTGDKGAGGQWKLQGGGLRKRLKWRSRLRVWFVPTFLGWGVVPTGAFYVLLTVHLGSVLINVRVIVNDQLDPQFLLCSFQISTCFEHPCAHHQEN